MTPKRQSQAGGDRGRAAGEAARLEARITAALGELAAMVGELAALAVQAGAGSAGAAEPVPGVAPRLLSVAHTAAALGLGESTVHSLIRSGAIGSVKIGTARRVPVEALDLYVAGLAPIGG